MFFATSSSIIVILYTNLNNTLFKPFSKITPSVGERRMKI